ncbi:hypothetical protein [Meiothermus hypogaeus]|uniref:Annexin VII n=2 Tax=Meiothermus hypogaeus TaxID=884155 RepID=A0A511QXA3_9DEIN|nr:hypothetical protein [Meiothermus hypogaeus]RIH79950.1 hypothetical protein Mhypo_00815 [Meiothermus hypogaeus]GEM82009.1 hypothetical protein MHY01S_01750 [Meiothermus hypogaeus NBRC 106114]GIW35945.1 MAG: hypothetical protein KatS3mg073_0090 [Meiothermus sp.]
MSKTAREYDELTYREARRQAIRQMVDGYGEAVVLQDEHGYWGLYYFYWSQEPPPEARPHWMEGPLPDPAAFRPPYEVKTWLEENGYETFQNDLD